MKVDINLLPPEYRPKRWALPLSVGLAVVILAVGYYGYGFLMKNDASHSELEALQSQLDSVNNEIQSLINDTTIREYKDQIAQAQAEVAELNTMEQDYEAYYADRVYWKSVIQTIRELAPSDVILTEFEQEGDNEITVEGELSSGVENSIVIVEYAEQLENRGMFSQVAFEIDVDERQVEGSDKTEEIFVFTLLLEVKTGGVQ